MGCQLMVHAIIDEYKRQGDIVLRGPDAGIYDAINKGISVSEGDIIAILNCDDYYLHNDVINLVVDQFDEKTDMVYAGTRYFTSANLKYVDYLPTQYMGKGSFRAGWHLPHPSFFVKKKCYDTGGVFDLKLKVAADFDLMLRFFEIMDFQSSRLGQILVGMSSGGYSSKFSSILLGMKEISYSFKKNSLEVPKFYFIKRYGKKLFQRKLSLIKGRHKT